VTDIDGRVIAVKVAIDSPGKEDEDINAVAETEETAPIRSSLESFPSVSQLQSQLTSTSFGQVESGGHLSLSR
jgi:hypothetical protein